MDNLFFYIGLHHYLIFALILFLIGACGVIICKNIIKLLLCIEFMLSAVNINFIAFASFCDSIKLHGFIFALFYTALGAVELAIALIIFYLMYRDKRSICTDYYKELKK